MAECGLQLSKVQVIWPAHLCKKDSIRSGSISDRFQDAIPADVHSRVGQLRLEDEDEPHESADDRRLELVACDGRLSVSEKELTAFSEHFARMCQSNMRETVTGTVELTEFPLATLKSMADFMTDGILPSTRDDLKRLYHLSGYILHVQMEEQIAKALLDGIGPEDLGGLTSFAASEPTGILYDMLIDHMASLCSYKWFCENVNILAEMPSTALVDLLSHDDLAVTSEVEVVLMIDAWITAYPEVSAQDLICVVRKNWLQDQHREVFSRVFMTSSNESLAQRSSAVPTDECDDQRKTSNMMPRRRYFNHVHFIVLDTTMKCQNEADLFVASVDLPSLVLPRFQLMPKFVTTVQLVCATEGAPTRILAKMELPDPGDGGKIATQTPFKLVYFPQFDGYDGPVAFMTVTGGVVSLRIESDELQCKFISLNEFVSGELTKLADICACPRGLIIYIQKAEVDMLLLLQDGNFLRNVTTFQEPMTRPRLYMKNGLLHVECQYAHTTCIIEINQFTVVQRFHGPPITSNRKIVCDDLKDIMDWMDGAEGRECSTLWKRCDIGKGNPRDIDMDKASASLISSPFMVGCDDELRFNRRKTVSLFVLPEGPELLKLEGESLTHVVGFLPRRLFTADGLCQPLPRQ